jgi:hypothetical protein
MLLDQRRRQIAYRLKRRLAPGVDNQPIVEREEQRSTLEARRRAEIARTARRRARVEWLQRALGLAAAFGVLALAVAVGAFR